MSKIIKVTKLDAATRQVETALKLWFSDGDPVSIHTLLYASVDIIHALHGRATGKRLFFENDAMQRRPGLVQAVKDWPNFFKHGRRHELDRVLSFKPEANLIFFSACMAGLAKIGAPTSDLQEALAYWLLIHKPDYFPASEVEKRPTGEALRQIASLNKQEFLDAVLHTIRKHKATRR